jgi:hypothetical protein
MKKYTVYEIEKLTGGKLTKYKLNQAILKGDLVAEEVKGKKKGKGVPKYYIFENDLDNYLKKLDEQKKKRINFPGEEEVTPISSEIVDMVKELTEQKDRSFQKQNEQIETLKERIKLLEVQNSKIKPLLDAEEAKRDSESKQATERRELLMELANIGVFSIARKNEILKQLSKLS